MTVVFARAPLRVSLGGGGTDLPSYYREHEGFVLAAAIDKFVYMLVHTTFQKRYRLKYSEIEEVDEVSSIKHPLLREVLLRHWKGSPLEIASVADVPAGTGLGSSGAFTVCLLKALSRARTVPATPATLAEDACKIEIDVLGDPVGKQDQYVSAFGGVCAYTFCRDERVEVEPIELSADCLRRLRDQLLLFYTGDARSASAVLSDQDDRSRRGDAAMVENLHRVKERGYASRDLLSTGDVVGFAELMHEHWLEKRSRSPAMTNDRVDRLYAAARDAGTIGGKLVGAGGGGFLMVLTAHPEETRAAMDAEGAEELPFAFEFDGATATEWR
jgi:D-glycero-alpha-D-manno-heptose-7-phosphate kinase